MNMNGVFFLKRDLAALYMYNAIESLAIVE